MDLVPSPLIGAGLSGEDGFQALWPLSARVPDMKGGQKDCGVPSFAEIEMNFDDFQAQALIDNMTPCSTINHRALDVLQLR